MFYQHLKDINLKVIQSLNEQQIIELDNILSSILPGSTFSPHAISYKMGISKNEIEKILVSLSDMNLIDILFVLKCNNENFDHVHTITYSSYRELVTYVLNNDGICNFCDAELLEKNTEVFFKMPPTDTKKVLL